MILCSPSPRHYAAGNRPLRPQREYTRLNHGRQRVMKAINNHNESMSAPAYRRRPLRREVEFMHYSIPTQAEMQAQMNPTHHRPAVGNQLPRRQTFTNYQRRAAFNHNHVATGGIQLPITSITVFTTCVIQYYQSPCTGKHQAPRTRHSRTMHPTPGLIQGPSTSHQAFEHQAPHTRPHPRTKHLAPGITQAPITSHQAAFRRQSHRLRHPSVAPGLVQAPITSLQASFSHQAPRQAAFKYQSPRTTRCHHLATTPRCLQSGMNILATPRAEPTMDRTGQDLYRKHTGQPG